MRKILIANRGEIALRIIRTCQEMGIGSVAVFSEADRKALHVRLADEARCIGEAAPAKSYLNMDRVIEAAKESGADAIHPGYGFLSENAAFAERCEKEKLIFIGPPSSAMRMMGDKLAARNAVVKLGVPVVPGVKEPVTKLSELTKAANHIGFPVLLKAVAGGGGKGIRIVRQAGDLESAWQLAQSEAKGAFGVPDVFVEKYIQNPRHIELQIFADKHGNAVHMGERECSIQRRHQKLIEETPSTFVTPELRETMGALAVKIAKAAGYVGAGTMEFLVDAQRNFYFLEMNTRLQVEHTVTEMVLGLDLVRLQIEVARGGRLPFAQEDLNARGCAIECRICAEDPEAGFVPSIGTVQDFQAPGGSGVRFDSAIYPGMDVSLSYDPMLAKLIVWAADRPTAIEKMKLALREFHLDGVKTTVPLFRKLLRDPDVVKGNIHTHFLEAWLGEKHKNTRAKYEEVALIAAVLHRMTGAHVPGARSNGHPEAARESAWLMAGRQRQHKRV